MGVFGRTAYAPGGGRLSVIRPVPGSSPVCGPYGGRPHRTGSPPPRQKILTTLTIRPSSVAIGARAGEPGRLLGGVDRCAAGGLVTWENRRPGGDGGSLIV